MLDLIVSVPDHYLSFYLGKNVLLSVMMVCTFRGIFLHVPVHFYRVGMGSPSCTPVPCPNPSYSLGEEQAVQKTNNNSCIIYSSSLFYRQSTSMGSCLHYQDLLVLIKHSQVSNRFG